MNVPDLLADLRSALGAEGVLAKPHERLVYDADAFTIARGRPDVVVLPRHTEDVAALMRIAAKHGMPVIPRGAGTGLSGGCMAPEGGIMIALTRMTRILAIDPLNRSALVEAGVVNLKLSQAAKPHALHFAPDPSSQSACTLGGNVAENAGGPHTLKYGVTTNHVLGLEVVTPDGETVWLGGPAEDAPGYDLMGLFVGSEGTLGIVTRMLLRLTPNPPAVRTMLAAFETVEEASRAVSSLIASGIIPAALEMMDQTIVAAVEAAFAFGFPQDAGAVLILELDGLEAGLDTQAERAIALCRAAGARDLRIAKDDAERERLWTARKKAIGAVGRLAPSKVTQDGVIPRTQLPRVLSRISEIADRFGLRIANVFHAGDGNLHPVILFDERDPEQVQRVLAAGSAILDVCLEAGGSLSGEHGIGVEKQEHMARMFAPEDLAAMRRVRMALDPAERMNPGKLLPTPSSCRETPRLGILGGSQ